MNRLREFRKRAFLSEVRLAKLAGVTPMTISRLEAGISCPYPETQKKIATALKVDVHEIFDPALRPISSNERQVNCRWCHGQLIGLHWNPTRCELIVRKMPRAVKVHENGFFYHEDCLKEKLRIGLYIFKSSQK